MKYEIPMEVRLEMEEYLDEYLEMWRECALEVRKRKCNKANKSEVRRSKMYKDLPKAVQTVIETHLAENEFVLAKLIFDAWNLAGEPDPMDQALINRYEVTSVNS